MTTTRPDVHPPQHIPQRPPIMRRTTADLALGQARAADDPDADSSAMSPVRKAAIVLVSLDQSLASQLLSHLDRSAVEAVTWEIATARAC